MNKENKKLAQQKKAQERAKAERRKKITQALGFWVPVVVAVVVVFVLIWAIANSDSNGTSSQGEASQTTEQTSQSTGTDALNTESANTQEATPVLNTEEGLEVKDGNTVNIDFVGYIDGEAFEGGDSKGNGYDLIIGSNAFIDGFEDGLIGHTVGETVTLELTFPEPYALNPDYAGKDVTFDVTINGVYEE